MGVRISELPESQELFEGCCFPVVTYNETKKVTFGQLKEKLQQELHIEEQDPTVPAFVKQITRADIERWNQHSDVPTKLSQLEDDSTHRLVTDAEKSTWSNKSDFSGDYEDLQNIPTAFPPEAHTHNYNEITNKPTIPSALSDLTADSTHRTVTDAEKQTWSSKQDALGFTPENVANKVTSISASSTDTQYPTAKCLYDIVGNIEALLAEV